MISASNRSNNALQISCPEVDRDIFIYNKVLFFFEVIYNKVLVRWTAGSHYRSLVGSGSESRGLRRTHARTHLPTYVRASPESRIDDVASPQPATASRPRRGKGKGMARWPTRRTPETESKTVMCVQQIKYQARRKIFASCKVQVGSAFSCVRVYIIAKKKSRNTEFRGEEAGALDLRELRAFVEQLGAQGVACHGHTCHAWPASSVDHETRLLGPLFSALIFFYTNATNVGCPFVVSMVIFFLRDSQHGEMRATNTRVRRAQEVAGDRGPNRRRDKEKSAPERAEKKQNTPNSHRRKIRTTPNCSAGERLAPVRLPKHGVEPWSGSMVWERPCARADKRYLPRSCGGHFRSRPA